MEVHSDKPPRFSWVAFAHFSGRSERWTRGLYKRGWFTLEDVKCEAHYVSDSGHTPFTSVDTRCKNSGSGRLDLPYPMAVLTDQVLTTQETGHLLLVVCAAAVAVRFIWGNRSRGYFVLFTCMKCLFDQQLDGGTRLWL